MKRFPSDVTGLLSGDGDGARLSKDSPYAFLDVVPRARAKAAATLLDAELYDTLRPMESPIPRSSLTGMTENYRELLPKTVKVRTSNFERERHASTRAADRIGLREMLGSPGLHALAERVSGLRLRPEPGMQVILYENGSYSGPHNDHHPESPELRRGFVDVHLSFADPRAAQQLLVYERRGHFTEAVEVARPGLSVYRLPFWHYTTPLLPRVDGTPVRRWLLLASYTVARGRA